MIALAGARDGNQLRGTSKQGPRLLPRPGSQQRMRSRVRPASLQVSCLPVHSCHSSGIGRPRIRKITNIADQASRLTGVYPKARRHSCQEQGRRSTCSGGAIESARIARKRPKRSTAGGARCHPAGQRRIPVLATFLALACAALLADIARTPAFLRPVARTTVRSVKKDFFRTGHGSTITDGG